MKFTLISESLRGKNSISDNEVLDLIDECMEICEKAGYHIDDLQLAEGQNFGTYGQFTFPKNPETGGGTLTLNSYTYKGDRNELKNTILHELAHYIDFWEQFDEGIIFFNRSCGKYQTRRDNKFKPHGPRWKAIAAKLSRIGGVNIQRTGDVPIINDEGKSRKDVAKYVFKCEKCGSEISYMRSSKFTQTYNEIMKNGKPRWTCARCGGKFVKIRG